MQNEKWYIIINPAAGNGAGRRQWARIEATIRAQLPNSTLTFTESPGHAIALVAEALRQGYRHFIGAGGDGTNNEMINGIFTQAEVPTSEVHYTLLPLGTGNDWVRTHRIPHRLSDWLSMLAAGKVLLHDIGLLTFQAQDERRQRYFINVAGLAYDAFVVAYTNRYRRWAVHKWSYLLMVLRCLFLYRLPRAQVLFDGQCFDHHYYTINIGIGRYSGGGMQLTPHAMPNSGQLALTLARRVSKLGVIFNIWRFYNGTLPQHPKIDIFQTKHIEVLSEQNVGLEADGELLGETPVTCTILPGALRVIVP
ncbi:MAG TPA: diacylglycerol kinase family lipid kinase [Saprospiraceae bacterium]|nr:diacylglycerol kinase family lipid kinase [Saprospiraceae bacterium]HMP24306.1 diacylglycerol kinase family lipid kinase [Saprospiraceae bacterium]